MKILLDKWLLHQPLFRGDYTKNVTFTALFELFKSKDRCVEIDTSHDRQTVYEMVVRQLAEFTDASLAAKPLTERAEVLLGLRPHPGARESGSS